MLQRYPLQRRSNLMTKSNVILITGAAGFIGSHLVDYLLEEGVSPKRLRLIIAPWDTTENLSQHKNLEIHKIDIRDKKALSTVAKGCEYIYHLAAKIDFDGKTYQEYEEVNVTPTETLLKVAVKNKVKKFIFYSSIGVHGLPAGIGNIINWDESHPPTYTNDYGKSKWQGEEIVRQYHEKYKLPYAIIRPASVYGPREKGPTLALFRAIKNKLFVMIGDGKNKMHYVFVKDLVAATYLAAQSKKVAGEYIVGAARPEEFMSIAQAIADSISVQLSSIKIPTPIALILATISDFVFKIFGKKSPLYPERVRTMTTSYYYSINKAKEELGYQPQFSIKKGMQIAGKWYSDHGYL